MIHTKALLLSVVLLAMAPIEIVAGTRLCVHIEADQNQKDSFFKLVLNELAHHPSHRVVDSECQSLLTVKFFSLEDVNYLTCRINREVPVRYDFSNPADLASKLSQAISQVLVHDPVYLSDDITHYNAIQRAAHSILKRGNNYWRLEIYQGIGNGNNNVAFAPGGAVSISRGADHWQVYTRLYFGGWPGPVAGSDRILRIKTGADVGLTYEFNALSNASFYASAGLGLQYLRYKGRLDPADENSIDHRNDFGPTFHLRFGFRFLRVYDFDCDIFVAGYLPMFPADADTGLGDFYPPSLQAGFGVGF